ncbi:hypothetical protein GCK72_007897 [Caenorhabditis remanei]|uniref:DUF38 domain-containing protein n=1 Tax=Caenorhabditis remanei TaxID=31234 RepID=A0A6A5HNP5_CAERE|nr:hypothetical protein GCK72_007897 [Caenorhabditis remanei]KAF1767937.1 hypothetical protein GCK72_007897 [Caenorhabditis remanei]
MPLPLSYPGLRCVLEHLEAVKRAHIIGRSPGLQKLDKLIPLCLGEFCITRDEMAINRLKIKYDEDEVEFKMNDKTFSRKGIENREDRMKKCINFYICGRSIVNVNSLSWNLYSLQDSVALKFRVNSLGAPYSCLHNAIVFIDPRSFPLKTALTTISNTSTYDDQVVKSAESLTLFLLNDRIVTVEDIKKLNNKKVVLERIRYSRIEIVSLIQYHIETKKVTETTFMISTKRTDDINEMLYEFEQTFGEYKSDLDDVNERFIPGSSKFLIPINNESRIQVYAIEDPKEGGGWKIVLKPVLAVLGL